MIRKYEQSDIDQILKIWLTASIIAHKFVPKDFWKSKVKDIKEIYIPMAETYVYEDRGIVEGFIALIDNTIAAVFVTPGNQGKGIGKLLINKAKKIRKNLNLCVYKENQNSTEFYKKCGFIVKKEQIDELTGHPELVMEFNS